MERLTWCEISKEALLHNLREFRRLVGPQCRLAPVVKANAYGHGLEIAAKVFAEGGADALCVHDAWEARRVRDAGIDLPIVILGPVFPEQVVETVKLGAIQFVVSEVAFLDAMEEAGRHLGLSFDCFLKLETGTNRQGMRPEEVIEAAKKMARLKHVHLIGISSHFADIEDTTDHTFAKGQMAKFQQVVAELERAGIGVEMQSIANTAATILWPEAHLDMVRVGIGAYGMWPSSETLVAAALTHRHRINLRPALTWKTKISHLKTVPPGEFIGYGRTFRTTHRTRLAVLPVGYYDGYDRGVSNAAHVLIGGQRAQVRGRVCMNLIMVDVTDIPEARVGQEVVLLGRDGSEAVTAEQFAQWAHTINYEVTTRIAESVPRILV